MIIMDMLSQSNFLQLGIIAAIIVGWLFMLNIIGNGVAAKFAAEKKEPAVITSAGKSNDGAITAAITAAVTEYRKAK